MLARLARVDPALLHPIQHGSAQAQHDLLGLKLRNALVRTRVNLINAVRFTLKSLGHSVRNPSSESFHKTVLADVGFTGKVFSFQCSGSKASSLDLTNSPACCGS